jgi:excisionase family DNA binding protein
MTDLPALLAALGRIPTRVGALEVQIARLTEELARLRSLVPPALVTVPQAAAAFKVSTSTVRRWVKDGSVPVVKVGNTVRVDLGRLHGSDGAKVARLAHIATTGGRT